MIYVSGNYFLRVVDHRKLWHLILLRKVAEVVHRMPKDLVHRGRAHQPVVALSGRLLLQLALRITVAVFYATWMLDMRPLVMLVGFFAGQSKFSQQFFSYFNLVLRGFSSDGFEELPEWWKRYL
jgi:hypothetical protein